MKYLDSHKKVLSSEMVISDVCADCNNNKLSYLDVYLCQLYDKDFKNFREEKKAFIYEYDYELLLRTLLKITYNSSRIKSRENNFFSKYRNYILYGGDVREEIVLKLDIVTPSILNGKKIYPKSARCATIDVGLESDNFIVRLISLNSYYFYLLISKEDQIEINLVSELQEFIQRIPGSIINPYTKSTEIYNFSNEDTTSIHLELVNKIGKAKR